jgi:hypothetical protein
MAIVAMLVLAAIAALPSGSSVSQDEYQVLACVLDSLWAKPTYGPYFISPAPIKNAFHDMTAEAAFYDQHATPDRSLYPLLRELISDADLKSRQDAEFKAELPAHTVYKLYAPEKNSSSKRGKALHDIYSSFPKFGGFVHFSRIGFSGDKRFALVYTTLYRGPLEAADYLLLLERKDGRWQIIKRNCKDVS